MLIVMVRVVVRVVVVVVAVAVVMVMVMVLSVEGEGGSHYRHLQEWCHGRRRGSVSKRRGEKMRAGTSGFEITIMVVVVLNGVGKKRCSTETVLLALTVMVQRIIQRTAVRHRHLVARELAATWARRTSPTPPRSCLVVNNPGKDKSW